MGFIRLNVLLVFSFCEVEFPSHAVKLAIISNPKVFYRRKMTADAKIGLLGGGADVDCRIFFRENGLASLLYGHAEEEAHGHCQEQADAPSDPGCPMEVFGWEMVDGVLQRQGGNGA